MRARSILRSVLAARLGRPELSLQFILGEHGKPSLQETTLEFNLSHAGDYAMIAISDGRPVGVDIERMRPKVNITRLLHRIGETALPTTEAELWSRWTQREARTKAIGGQLMAPVPDHVIAVDVEAPEGYRAAVAVLGATPQLRLNSLPN